MIKAEIISIGNELLSGITVNTNSSWIAQQLTRIGIMVCWVTTIGDKKEHIEYALTIATSRADIILCTGGLGPTPDDITKNSICKFFQTRLVLHQPTLDTITQIFKRRKIKMPGVNRSQAMVPARARIIPNKLGTAPGLVFMESNKLYSFMPGVPKEMKRMIEQEILPIIKNKYKLTPQRTYLLRTTGMAESMLYEKLDPVFRKFPDIEVAYLPKFSGVDIRLKCDPEARSAESRLEILISKCKEIIGSYIYTEKGEELQEIIGMLLKKDSLTLAVAESFTGGLIADRITDIPGSSTYFLGSVVTYSNKSKRHLLHVNEKTIEKYGAVSKQAVEEMAHGVQKLFGCDCAIASTGIAGPTGATDTKSVGLCFLAALYHDKIITKQFNFGTDRRINKERGAVAGLELLRKLLLSIQNK
jgi:nicotinamide-nucleotide amidase